MVAFSTDSFFLFSFLENIVDDHPIHNDYILLYIPPRIASALIKRSEPRDYESGKTSIKIQALLFIFFSFFSNAPFFGEPVHRSFSHFPTASTGPDVQIRSTQRSRLHCSTKRRGDDAQPFSPSPLASFN